MTVINIKKKFVLPLSLLLRYALRHIYEPKTMSKADRDLMESSIVNWSNKVNISEQDLHNLQAICAGLKKNEEGLLDKRKQLVKMHDIDWRKFHRLIEAQPRGGYAW